MAIQIMRGTPNQWESDDKVLEYGQLAVSGDKTTTSKPVIKIGNGVDKFSDLPAINPDSQIILSGTTAPSNDLGSDGDMYYLYSE